MDEHEGFTALSLAVAGVAAVDPAHYDRPIEACPGWTVRDVVDHLGSVHAWVRGVVERADADPAPRDRSLSGPEVDVRARYLAEADALMQALHAADHDQVVGTFAGPRPIRWYVRRQAHETTMHRWDVESAIGAPVALDPGMAADGIDELLTELAPARARGAGLTVDGTIHVHATDVPGEWLATLAPGADEPVTVVREHAKGDVAVRGPAAELLLVLWGRHPLEAVEVFGDTDRLRAFLEAARF